VQLSHAMVVFCLNQRCLPHVEGREAHAKLIYGTTELIRELIRYNTICLWRRSCMPNFSAHLVYEALSYQGMRP
jgi:hypothetical protein